MTAPRFADEARGPWARPQGVALDVGIVVVGLGVTAFYYAVYGHGTGPTLLPALLSAAAILPLLVRRTHPAACLAAVTAVSVLQVVTLGQPTWGQAAVPVTVYSVAAYAGPRLLGVAVATGLVGAVVGPVDWLARDGGAVVVLAGVVFCGVLVVASAAVGLLGRTRRAYVDQLIDRGVRLEREAAQQAELAASDERARIAREMHDVVAHGLSVMVVQADGARYQLDQAPARAGAALDAIAETGRESLAEMRRMLGLLRSEDPTGTRPQPGLTDLAFLLEHSGLEPVVELPDPLPEVGQGVGLAAYRIVQESLTNVRKHAGPAARVEVAVRAEPGVLEIRVRDHGVGAGATGPDPAGHGLVGMRERAAVHGGGLHAGPCPDGGFEVRASLPHGGAR